MTTTTLNVLNSLPSSCPRDDEDDGTAMLELMRDLYPICRSITGNGTRRSLAIIGERIPLRIHEVPTGTPILDWTVPKEWNIRSAYIATRDGCRVVDFADSNLHILQYSRPMDRIVPIAELQEHLHSLPETPDRIPYRTAYFADTWGFCLTQRQRDSLNQAEYRVVIDATLEDGHLSYGELVLPGDSEEEVLFSCHSCHPSLANDNLSGIAVATRLARHLERRAHRFTYRLLFIPGMLGSLTWLSRNEHIVPKVRHGLVLSCLGDPGATTYKQSRRGDAAIDRYVAHVLRHRGSPFRVTPFTPYGYDERQYCSPGFDLPVGCFMRSPNGTFPEYHTSADNLEFVREDCLVDSLEKLKAVVDVIEGDATYRSLNPKGEPQLGRRGLYGAISGHKDPAAAQMALLWTLNLADGRHTLFDIAERAEMPFADIRDAADRLIAVKLLEPVAS
jgi:aminopeptidase-like protein